jgi:hypothetical protein
MSYIGFRVADRKDLVALYNNIDTTSDSVEISNNNKPKYTVMMTDSDSTRTSVQAIGVTNEQSRNGIHTYEPRGWSKHLHCV